VYVVAYRVKGTQLLSLYSAVALGDPRVLWLVSPALDRRHLGLQCSRLDRAASQDATESVPKVIGSWRSDVEPRRLGLGDERWIEIWRNALADHVTHNKLTRGRAILWLTECECDLSTMTSQARSSSRPAESQIVSVSRLGRSRLRGRGRWRWLWLVTTAVTRHRGDDDGDWWPVVSVCDSAPSSSSRWRQDDRVSKQDSTRWCLKPMTGTSHAYWS